MKQGQEKTPRGGGHRGAAEGGTLRASSCDDATDDGGPRQRRRLATDEDGRLRPEVRVQLRSGSRTAFDVEEFARLLWRADHPSRWEVYHTPNQANTVLVRYKGRK